MKSISFGKITMQFLKCSNCKWPIWRIIDRPIEKEGLKWQILRRNNICQECYATGDFR